VPDDKSRLAYGLGSRDSVDARVLERCDDATRQHADLLVLGGRRLDALDGPKAFALTARTFGGPAAIAFFDSAAAVRTFLTRFVERGVPSVWHAGAIVGVDVFGLDLDDPETRSKVCDQPRGVWLRAMAGSDELFDPRERPPIDATRRRTREPSR
jgi:hypothetical protein